MHAAEKAVGGSEVSAEPVRILITGATSAIGAALAQAYARSDTVLYLHGRNGQVLEQVAKVCQAQGAQTVLQIQDLREFDAWRDWLGSLPAMDLVIVNAGLNTHAIAVGESEPWVDVEALLDVNIKASMLTIQSVLPAMRVRSRGQIAVMSSLAAYFGLPVTPAYCASKAAIKAYGEALRGAEIVNGIWVNVVMPGYVASPMCDAMPGPKLFLWSPQRAAQKIQRGLAKNQARISFPFPLNVGTWCLSVLPASVSMYLVRKLGYVRC
ncbi:SDR family NAD(P)-dependent oxidoreductase [Orrella sp. 11846]|uniref:SDR family NAD(P)-dependent oxidoreductase n=1 Tax=Orrella sp. 11846 TaxID=3409913 RepID=UPI003B59EE89